MQISAEMLAAIPRGGGGAKASWRRRGAPRKVEVLSPWTRALGLDRRADVCPWQGRRPAGLGRRGAAGLPGQTCDLRGGSSLLSRRGWRGWALEGGAWDAEADYGDEAQDTSGADFPKIGRCEKHHLGTY